MMHNLVIDIGNSFVKTAVFHERELIYFNRLQKLNRVDLMAVVAKFGIKNTVLSSVATTADDCIEYLKDNTNYTSFNTQILAGITNNYQSIATLGLDRWAKVIAAHTLYNGQNCLMIDAGTCITYDVLTDKSVYNGGSISLGIKMRFDALEHYTHRLPLISFDEAEKEIPEGNNTVNAIKNGVLQGVVNEVEGYINLENNRNLNLKVLLTGGGAEFLSKQLKNSIFASQITLDPYLVLKGLNEVIAL